MLAACDLQETHMPRLCEGPDVTGELRAEVAEAWGMSRAPVAAGGGDNAAGAVGVGVIDPGEAFLSLGTSGVLFLANKSFLPNPARAVHAFCHALPDRWHQMTVMLSAASCVDWAARATGAGSAAALFDRLSARARMDGPEIFLPYLSGERTPHNDAHARGVLFGLNHDSDAEAIGQAVLEGVAFAFADGLDALVEAGADVGQISVIGGGARSPWWGKVLAAALGRTLAYRQGSETGPAFGAARLARLAVTGENAADVCAPPPIAAIAEPDGRDVERLSIKRATFSRLYGDLRARFRGEM
jgi:xylulokinase